MEIGFLLVGLIFAAAGVAIVFSELKARRGTQPASGRVVGFSTGRRKNRASPSFHSIAEYIGFDGRKRYIQSSVGSSAPLHAVGDSVTILANTTEPHRAVFQSGISFIIGFIVASMGLACIAVFWVTFRASTFSVITAAVILVAISFKLKKVMRKQPLSFKAWQAYKSQALGPKVYDDESKDQIAWADPVSVAEAGRQYEKSQRFAVPFLFVFGFSVALLGHYFYVKTEAFLEKAGHAAGQVVELKRVESSEGDSTWAPVVEFNDEEGRQQRFVERISSNPSGYHAGQAVNVLYDPENPTEAQIDRGRANHWIAILLGSVGGLFIMLGAFSRRRRKSVRDQRTTPDFSQDDSTPGSTAP